MQADVAIDELGAAFDMKQTVVKHEIAIGVIRWVGDHDEMNARCRRIAGHRIRARNQRRVVERRPDVAGHNQDGAARKQRGSRRNAAGRLERRRFDRPLNAHAPSIAIIEKFGQLSRVV